MSIKSKVLGIVAAVGISLSAAIPVLADTSATGGDTADLFLTLDENGVFAVEIAAASFTSPLDVTAVTGGTATGSILIHYTDTKSYRDAFHTKLVASDFESLSVDIPLTTDPYTIPASSLTIVKNYNPAQGRWSDLGPRIGDIGATQSGVDNAYPCNTGGLDVPGAGLVGYEIWGPGDSNSLETQRTINCGFEGPGTAVPAFDGTVSKVDIELVVPVGQPADTYKSVLTLTVEPVL